MLDDDFAEEYADDDAQLACLRRPNFEAARPAGRVDNVHDAEEVLVVELRDGVALGAEVVEDEHDAGRHIVHGVLHTAEEERRLWSSLLVVLELVLLQPGSRCFAGHAARHGSLKA